MLCALAGWATDYALLVLRKENAFAYVIF